MTEYAHPLVEWVQAQINYIFDDFPDPYELTAARMKFSYGVDYTPEMHRGAHTPLYCPGCVCVCPSPPECTCHALVGREFDGCNCGAFTWQEAAEPRQSTREVLARFELHTDPPAWGFDPIQSDERRYRRRQTRQRVRQALSDWRPERAPHLKQKGVRRISPRWRELLEAWAAARGKKL